MLMRTSIGSASVTGLTLNRLENVSCGLSFTKCGGGLRLLSRNEQFA